MDPKDIEVVNPPSDGISSLSFSPKANYLAASSWDNQVRVYEVQATGNTIPQASYAHEGPVLCVKWSADGTKVISGGADNAGRLYDITTGQSQQIAQHTAPIKSITYLDQNIVATGSWDKTIKYWDMRTPNPLGTINLSDRLYSMDSLGQLLVAATADNMLSVVNLNNPTVVFRQDRSPLKHQIRKVACFTVGKGYAISSIEGRIGIQYIEDQDKSKSFSFKCHRDETSKKIYSVNDVSFHPVHGTFSTAGSDGFVHIWDKDRRQRLKAFSKLNGTVSCTAFNYDGSILAYAVSYDWSKGYKFASDTNKIYLHAVGDAAKPNSKK